MTHSSSLIVSIHDDNLSRCMMWDLMAALICCCREFRFFGWSDVPDSMGQILLYQKNVTIWNIKMWYSTAHLLQTSCLNRFNIHHFDNVQILETMFSPAETVVNRTWFCLRRHGQEKERSTDLMVLSFRITASTMAMSEDIQSPGWLSAPVQESGTGWEHLQQCFILQQIQHKNNRMVFPLKILKT